MSLSLVSYLPAANAQKTLGWLEPTSIIIDSQEISIQAKIDSGADHSSLHATMIKRFMKDNQAWVKFTTINQFIMEAPLYREAKIKTKLAGFNARPVILMNICLAGIIRKIEVNLVDRGHFSKAFLIGRSALSGFIIDPNKTQLTTEINCKIAQ